MCIDFVASFMFWKFENDRTSSTEVIQEQQGVGLYSFCIILFYSIFYIFYIICYYIHIVPYYCILYSSSMKCMMHGSKTCPIPEVYPGTSVRPLVLPLSEYKCYGLDNLQQVPPLQSCYCFELSTVCWSLMEEYLPVEHARLDACLLVLFGFALALPLPQLLLVRATSTSLQRLFCIYCRRTLKFNNFEKLLYQIYLTLHILIKVHILCSL